MKHAGSGPAAQPATPALAHRFSHTRPGKAVSLAILLLARAAAMGVWFSSGSVIAIIERPANPGACMTGLRDPAT
jgi:hypothetical protein